MTLFENPFCVRKEILGIFKVYQKKITTQKKVTIENSFPLKKSYY